MDNFDLKKYLSEGKIYRDDIWYIEATEESADIVHAGPKYKEAVISIVKAKYPNISDKHLNDSIEGINQGYYDISRENARGDDPEDMEVSAEDFADEVIENYEDALIPLKEDVSSRFVKKYLSMGAPEVFEDIEDIESYSDRDKAILIFLDEEHGVTISDKLAKGIKDKAPADIIKYFQDEDYEYMSYGVMKRQLGVPAVTAMIWDEAGSNRHEDWYYHTKDKRNLNKVWRTKYPELDIPGFNKKNYDIRQGLAQELDDYYRGQARKQKGIDLEVPYEEYAAMYVQALKDEGAIK